MHYLPGPAYDALIADLADSFTTAARSTNHTLPEFLAMALARADILPEVCRADFEPRSEAVAV